MKLACVQLTTGRDPAANLPDMIARIRQAHQAGATFIGLPETCNFMEKGRKAMQARLRAEADMAELATLRGLAKELGIWLLAGSMIVAVEDADEGAPKAANRSLLIAPDGRIAARYDKIHMFDANVGDGHRYRESDSFAAGNRMVLADMAGMTIGLSICYDLRFPGLYRGLARAGARMLSIPAAFTFPSGKAHWHVLLRARAIETGCFVVAPAQCGTHADGRRTYGHAMIVLPWGEILAEVPTDDTNAAAGANDGIIHATLDPAAVTAARNAIPSLASNPDFS